ncbi:hypothetical protein MASR2M78_16280 [Treponema sp.]
MKDDPILTKASDFASRRRFDDAIRLLEPEVVRYHDSFRYYYILGLSCLWAGDSGGALTYFRRAREIKMRESGVLLGLAALHLRRGETDKALDLYLDILDKDPKNKKASRALEVVRKNGDSEALSSYLETGKLRHLYPPLPRRSTKPLAILLGSAVLLAVASLSALLVKGIIPSPFAAKYTRTFLESSSLSTDERSAPVHIGGSYRYVLSAQEVIASYETAQRLFQAFRDEAAKVELNRILESNASASVKVRARTLIAYAVVPGFDTLKDRFSYATVIKEPLLYRDCHIIWRGMAANLKLGEKSTSFDLLVGYDTQSSLEGIVPVRFDFALSVDQERPLEVLARVLPSSSSSNPLVLQGLALHQAATLSKTEK